MKLLLTSAGNTNKTIEKTLLELLEKPFEEASLVFIPTAANPTVEDKTWLVDDMYNFRKLAFKRFNIVDIAAVGKDIWLPILKNSDVIVIGGGDTYYLLEKIEESGLGKDINELIRNKVYVGISAGSMVTAKTVSLATSEVLYYEKYHGRKMKGLGFVDFELRPHLNSDFFPNVRIPRLKELAKQCGEAFYAIDDNTAIKVVDEIITVVSEGNWEKF